MERTPVSSSNILSIGYDDVSETLEVEFKNGTIYHYFNVPALIGEQLMSAPSVGTYFNANIRNVYGWQRA
jgi:hypothetical protein